MSISCLCTDPLQSPANNKCGALQLGNQIVKVFFQKETGTDFDGTTGNNVTVEADWQTRLAADDDDRIVIFENLAGAERPSSEPNKEDGNAVPYGGTEIIDRPQSLTAMFKYLSQDTFAKLNQVTCWDLTRMWFLDNNNYLWAIDTDGAGIPSVSVITGTYQQMGIGTKNSNPFTASWNNVCQPVPVAQLSFLKSIEYSNESGSTL
jgi:hypothetical protein